jgi:transposase
MEFSSRFIKRFKKGGALVYDVTSLSSNSKLMDLLEYGYNRDSDGLPQINLSVAVHKEQGLPIYYDIYPGSITDTSILHNTIEKLATLDIDDVALILDKGFFSETNLNDLRDAKLQFILPATFKNKSIKALVTMMKKDIEKGKHLQKYNGNILFVKEANITLGKYSHTVYVFFDPKRESDERIKLYHRLHSVIEILEHRKLRKWERPAKVFEDIAGEFKQYLSWRLDDNAYKIRVKEKAIAQRLNRMGFTIMFYNGKYTWNDVWGWYHERDIVEKVFLFTKNYLNTVPFNAQKTEVAKGLILVGFVALILRFKLLKMMKETDLNKQYSIPKLLLELSKIKRIKLKDGKYITSEVSKKQREIIKSLKIDHIISCA